MPGTSLQGVTTTGIYCQAECGARPRPDHVRPYPSAVAAEAAGFRPCLRCRPDRLPELAPAVPPAVAQALVLITDGFLDRHDEAGLALRVGYSSRQLRRLFADHVGASPDFVARSRRAHFARRLLDETDLSVAEVGFAAGFASVRQTNRVIKEIFGFAPSALRERRRRGDRRVVDGGLALRIPYRGDLPVDEIIDYLGSRAIPHVEAVADGRYRRSIDSCGHPGLIEVQALGDRRHLDIIAHLPTFASIIDDTARVRRLFGADIDPAPAAEMLGVDPLIGELVTARPGLRLPGAWDPFETATRVIIGQQVSVAGASTIAGRLAYRLGAPVEIEHAAIDRRFPSPEAVAGGDLAGLGMPDRRADTITHLARAMVDGSIDLSRRGDLDAIEAELVALPGVGPWTAQVIAGRVHRHPDAFPAGDLGLRRATARLLGRRAALSTAELAERAEAWRPHRAIAAAHLWFSGGSSHANPPTIRPHPDR